MTATITARTPDGRTVSRRTDAPYVAAVIYRDGTATWHQTIARADKKARRKGGTIAYVEQPQRERKCGNCDDMGVYMIGPSAVDRRMQRVYCHCESGQVMREGDEREAANRQFNIVAMDSAGVPQAARKGFYRATAGHAYRITEIKEYPREGRASRWGVFVGDTFSRQAWIVGPQGAADKVV